MITKNSFCYSFFDKKLDYYYQSLLKSITNEENEIDGIQVSFPKYHSKWRAGYSYSPCFTMPAFFQNSLPAAINAYKLISDDMPTSLMKCYLKLFELVYFDCIFAFFIYN